MTKEFSRVFIKDESGNLLVIKDRQGLWNFPGGKQEENEQAIVCAVREVKEELALEISRLESVFTDKLLFDGVEWIGHFYFAGVVKGKPTLNEPDKIKGVQFISDLEDVKFSSGLNPLLDFLTNKDVLTKKVTTWYST